jgi:hypothetical protein
MKSGRALLSRRGSDRRSVSRSPASLGVGSQAYPHNEGNQKAWIKVHQRRWLDQGKIEKLVLALRSIRSIHPELSEKIRTEAV